MGLGGDQAICRGGKTANRLVAVLCSFTVVFKNVKDARFQYCIRICCINDSL
jgi:hypothetical protein